MTDDTNSPQGLYEREAASALRNYLSAFERDDAKAMIWFERVWKLEGYAPDVVAFALGAAAAGDDMEATLESLEAKNYEQGE